MSGPYQPTCGSPTGEPPSPDLEPGIVSVVDATQVGGSPGRPVGPPRVTGAPAVVQQGTRPGPGSPAPTRTARLDRWLGRTLAGPVLAASAALSGLVLLNQVDPNEAGHYPSCPFLLLSGLHCPGCGSMRMLHHLTEGDVVDAFWMNPLGFLLLPVLLAYWGQWTHQVATGRPRGAPLTSWVVWAFLLVVGVYWVLRNLPGLEVLAPG